MPCAVQGASMVAQYATEELQVDLQGMSLRKSFYLAFGAAGALLRSNVIPWSGIALGTLFNCSSQHKPASTVLNSAAASVKSFI